jgi:hypothetical protein
MENNLLYYLFLYLYTLRIMGSLLVNMPDKMLEDLKKYSFQFDKSMSQCIREWIGVGMYSGSLVVHCNLIVSGGVYVSGTLMY